MGVTTSRKLGSTDHKDVSVGGYKDSKMNQKMDSKMKQKTDIEKVTHRGEIRLEISVDRSNLMPEKWELRKRFRWWRLAEQVKNDREKLDVETQAALYWAEEALERELRKAYGY